MFAVVIDVYIRFIRYNNNNNNIIHLQRPEFLASVHTNIPRSQMHY